MENEEKIPESLRVVPASEILAKIEKGEPVKYDNVIVKGDLDINKLILPRVEWKFLVTSPIEITKSQIEGDVIFSNTIFRETINFEQSRFNKKINFSDSQFSGEDFWSSQVAYSLTKAAHNLENEELSRYTILNESQFSKYTSFKGSQFNEDAIIWFSRFSGYIDFREAQFKRDANFMNSKFDRADFRGAKFSGNADFSESEFINPPSPFFGGTQFDGDALTFRGAKFKDSPENQEYACRRAKQLLEKNGDREEAGYHFYREMEAKRRQKPFFICYTEYIFIQLIFGYGVHPLRLWFCWLSFVGAFAILYWIAKGIDVTASGINGTVQLKDYIWFSIATAVTPGYAGYKPTPDFKLVAGLEAIFGTFMWAAFIATFARKYMR